MNTGDPGTVVHHAAWLSSGLILVTCSQSGPRSESYGTRQERPGRLFDLPETGAVAAFGCTQAELHALQGAVIVVRHGPRALPLPVRSILESTGDLATMLRESLAGYDAEVRAGLLAFLATLPLHVGASPVLSEQLRTAREALRERHPLSVATERTASPLSIDILCAVTARRFFVIGWAPDRARHPLRLTALSPEGETVELSPVALRDSEGAPGRFACLFDTRAPSATGGWVFTLEEEHGWVEAPQCPTVDGGDGALRAIVGVASGAGDDREMLLAEHVEPALADLQSALRARLATAAIRTYGAPHGDPELSIVLSLDRAGELLEHHLAQIVDDRSLCRCELVCVFDGPVDTEQTLWSVAELHELYGHALTAVVLPERGGSALMRDAGAAVASAARLLFLEAGVLPDRPGWLAPLTGFHSVTPAVGAVTAKVVRYDGAIALPERFAGLHASLPAANITSRISALSGTCTLIDAALYRRAAVAGWRYVWGGRADEDLAWRLTKAGYDCWYVPRVTLVRHDVDPEAQDDLRLADAYNTWRLGRAE